MQNKKEKSVDFLLISSEGFDIIETIMGKSGVHGKKEFFL
jgi:hypothetical protein